MRIFLVTALAAFAVAGAAAPVAAKEVTISVSHDDLDLSSAEDLATMDERIRHAAFKACKTTASSVVVARYDAQCRADLIEAAKAEVERRVASVSLPTVAMAD